MTFTQLSKPETYMTIHADGRVTVSDKLKPDETAARVLECMKTQFLADAQATKIRELQDRIKRLEEALDKTSKIGSKHIKQLEEAGDAMERTCDAISADKWRKAKEAKL